MPAASFAEILDAELGCTPVPPPARAWSGRPLTPPLFAFERPQTAAPRRASVQPALPAQPPPPARLTSSELQTLADARTLDALRGAYRTLARRYHPDRHPGCSPTERARLARLFAEATDSYRSLVRNL
jgi:hypothetical protein